jgi:hypothetical protein
MERAVELVVARYNEDLRWLRNVPPNLNVTVYDKSGAPDGAARPGSIALPNVGRESHTYLHHILRCYSFPAPVTIFCQGRPFDHAFDFHATLRRIAAEPSGVVGFEPFGHIVDTDTHDGARLFAPWSKNEDGRGLHGRAFHRRLTGEDGPDRYTFRLGAQFAVAREVIYGRSKTFYENALDISIHFPDAAHLFERSWTRVFGVENPDLKWLDGRETAYLKPIKRRVEGTST